MANITETNDWPAGVYQYAIGDIVDGGPDSLETLPLRQLAHRSLFQRLRNVTPWDSVLAGLYGYPQGACVMHAGVSWRSLVANNGVEPGTDDTRWERWAFSLDELETWLASYLPYGAPTACPNTGPVLATADRARIHKSPLGEYWMWLGDAWKVVASAYGVSERNTFQASAGVVTNLLSFTAHRSGVITFDCVAGCVAQAIGHQVVVRAWVDGVLVVTTPATAHQTGINIGARLAHARPYAAGTTFLLTVESSSAVQVGYDCGITYTA